MVRFMVLPTDQHAALREWLRSHRIKAAEYGGTLIIANLDGLLRIAGSKRPLTANERAVVKASRHRASSGPGPFDRFCQLPQSLTVELQRLVDQLRRAFPETPEVELLQLAQAQPSVRDGLLDPMTAWRTDPLGAEVLALLESVCEALARVGVRAEPGLGLGVVRGDELLDATVHITETTRLYELMRAEGLKAEPESNAPPFPESDWFHPDRDDQARHDDRTDTKALITASDRLRCAETALADVPELYRIIESSDVAAQERGHSFHRGMHIGWSWGADPRGQIYLDFLSEHRHPGMSASRFFADGTIEPIETPGSMRMASEDPDEDAELERRFIDRNRRLYNDLRHRGLLPDVGDNLFSQDVTEHFTTGPDHD